MLFFFSAVHRPDHALARQMDHRIEPRHAFHRHRRKRIPRNLFRILSRSAHEPHNLRLLRIEGVNKRPPNQPGSPTDQYASQLGPR